MAERPRRAQQREVRRLLADARHTEPMPVDVAARLDQVLTDLGAQQPSQQQDQQPAGLPGANVTDLASRRRRRAATLLVAAAAAVAIGVGLDRLSTSPSSNSSTTADRAATPSESEAGAEHSPAGSGSQGLSAPSDADRLTMVLRVRPDHFSDDAVRALQLVRHAVPVRDAPGTNAGNGSGNGSKKGAQKGARSDSVNGSTDGSTPRSTFACERADWGRGRLVGVRYEHGPAVLVVRPPHGATRVVDLFRCGSTDPLRSTTLPLR